MGTSRSIATVLLFSIAIALSLGSLLGSLLGSAISRSSPNSREIVIGALLANTAVWASLGQSSQLTLETAAEDINGYLEDTGSPTRVRIIFADTEGDPETALAKLKQMEAQGARIIIGPETSAEAEAIKPYADEHGLILISQSSTAGSLSIPGDNLFRFATDDAHEGAAVAALLATDGVKAIVPIWRDDAGNAGLHVATKASFESRGGYVFDGIAYSPTTTDYSATLTELRSQAQQATAQYGSSAVAIYLAAFDEAAMLLDQAQNDPELSSLKWYGSDGIALSDALLNDTNAAQMVTRIELASPLLGLEEQARERWEPISQRVIAKGSHTPDAFSLAAYDAFWVATLAYLSSGDPPSIEALKKALMQTSATYYGATGWTVLNEAGDRKYGDLDFWTIKSQQGTYQWTRVARYEETPGGVGRISR